MFLKVKLNKSKKFSILTGVFSYRGLGPQRLLRNSIATPIFVFSLKTLDIKDIVSIRGMLLLP